MGFRLRRGKYPPAYNPLTVLGVVNGTEDYEVEADDGADLIERLQEANRLGRDAFLEMDADG